MRITGYSLFKVPLDPEYKNVFDGYNYTNQYLTYLLNAYPHLDKTLVAEGQTRSIKMDGLSTTITVEGAQEDLKDYNYICISDIVTNRYTFFFILNCESRYDAREVVSGAKPTSTLTLKYDSFANNMERLQNSNYNDKCLIARRHVDDYETVVESGVTQLRTNALITEEVEAEVENMQDYIAPTPKVLWYKIRLGGDIKYSLWSGSSENPKPFNGAGCILSEQSTPVVYIPACVVYAQGNKITLATQYKTFNTTDNALLGIMRYCIVDDKLNGVSIDAPSALSATLTYYAPYKVSFRSTYVYIEDIVSNSANVEDNDIAIFSSPSVVIFWERKNDGTSKRGVPALYKPKVSSTLSLAFTAATYVADTAIPTDKLGSVDYDANVKIEGRLLKYPYSYTRVKIGDKLFAIRPKYSTQEYVLDIVFSESFTPRFQLYANDGSKFDKGYDVIKNNGEVVTYADSKEFYLRNNGNTLLADRINQSLGAVNAIASHVPSEREMSLSGTQYFGSLIAENMIAPLQASYKRTAAILDADNQVDMFNMPVVDAFDDLSQDSYTYQRVVIGNTEQKIKCYYSFHYYGSNVNRISSIRENTHKTYDFVRTVAASIPFISNVNERREIESAYNRGVTRWHIDTDNIGIGNNFKNFNRDLVNLSLTMYNFGG